MSADSQPPRGRDPDFSLCPRAPGQFCPRPERPAATVPWVSLRPERLGWGLGIQAAKATGMGWCELLLGYLLPRNKSPQNVVAQNNSQFISSCI